jgi:hypothetical protein
LQSQHKHVRARGHSEIPAPDFQWEDRVKFHPLLLKKP